MRYVGLQAVHHAEQLIQVSSVEEQLLEQRAVHNAQQDESIVVAASGVVSGVDCSLTALLAEVNGFLHLLDEGGQAVLDKHHQVLQTRYQVFVTFLILLLGDLEELAFVQVRDAPKVELDEEVGVQHHPALDYR